MRHKWIKVGVGSSKRTIQHKVVMCTMGKCSTQSKYSTFKVTQVVYDFIRSTKSGFKSSIFE